MPACRKTPAGETAAGGGAYNGAADSGEYRDNQLNVSAFSTDTVASTSDSKRFGSVSGDELSAAPGQPAGFRADRVSPDARLPGVVR